MLKKIILWLIILWILWLGFLKYNNYKYYNNYYTYNKENLELIKDYILNKDIEWYLYVDSNKYGDIYTDANNCFYMNQEVDNCIIWDIVPLLNDLKIDYLYTKDDIIWIKTKWKLYHHRDNNLVYDKNFFLWRKEWELLDLNENYAVVKIFNDNWWIKSSCYNCWWWGWD